MIKAEVVQLSGRPPRDNPRFVVTNLRQTPRFLYEKVYCGRGDIENCIKELHDGLQIDRTSCHKFWANQLRVLLTAAAYVLMKELRLRAVSEGGLRSPRVAGGRVVGRCDLVAARTRRQTRTASPHDTIRSVLNGHVPA